MELVLAAEAADLDSFCCAELLRQRYASQGKGVRALLPISRAELGWRLDVSGLMEYLRPLGWSCQLDFADTFSPSLLDDEHVNIHLVDRHHLPSDWWHGRPWLWQRVRTLTDHRPDTGGLAQVKDRTVEPVASCATLLYERFGEEPGPVWQPLLFAAAVLQDSELLASPRTTERDRAAAAELRTSLSPGDWEWLQGLPALRARSVFLPAGPQLCQDVKWTRAPKLPIAVVQGDADSFWCLSAADKAAESLASQGEQRVLLVLHKPPRPALRELSVWTDGGVRPRWLEDLLDWPEAGWRAERRLGRDVRVFVMGNSNLTRKDIFFRMECVLTKTGAWHQGEER